MSPPGKKDRRHHKRVRGEGKAQVPDFEHGLVVQFVERGIAEGRQKYLLDESAVSLPPLPWPSTIRWCSEMGSGQEPNGAGVATISGPRDPGILEVSSAVGMDNFRFTDHRVHRIGPVGT